MEPKSTLFDIFVSITGIIFTAKQIDSNSHNPNFQRQLIFDINVAFVKYLYERSQPQHFNSFFGIYQTSPDSLGRAEFALSEIIATDMILTKEGQARLSQIIGIIQKVILEKVPLESTEWTKLIKLFPKLKNYTASVEQTPIF